MLLSQKGTAIVANPFHTCLHEIYPGPTAGRSPEETAMGPGFCCSLKKGLPFLQPPFTHVYTKNTQAPRQAALQTRSANQCQTRNQNNSALVDRWLILRCRRFKASVLFYKARVQECRCRTVDVISTAYPRSHQLFRAKPATTLNQNRSRHRKSPTRSSD